MTNGPVLHQQRDGIVTLTLNRPESLNAMNEAMMGEFERILRPPRFTGRARSSPQRDHPVPER
jgi:1,4-dihydroxy-2-naphthoyl-CoA synthase